MTGRMTGRTTITFVHEPSADVSILDGYHIVEPVRDDMRVDFIRRDGSVTTFTLMGEAKRCGEAVNILRKRGPGNIVNDDVSREVWNELVANGFVLVAKQETFDWIS